MRQEWTMRRVLLVLTVAMVGGFGLIGSAHASECAPVQVVAFRTIVEEAAATLAKSATAALGLVKKAEEAIPCLTGPVTVADLTELFRIKAAAEFANQNRDGARNAFLQMAVIHPDLDCALLLNPIVSKASIKSALIMCNAAVTAARFSDRPAKVTEIRKGTELWIDGASRDTSQDVLGASLGAGRHLLQVKYADELISRWVDIEALQDNEPVHSQVVDLKEMGIFKVKQNIVQVGSLRVEGLKAGTEVSVDGRTRKDLPVITNLETGERHLLIKLNDGSVLGATVVISANQTEVYRIPGEQEPLVPAGTPPNYLALGSVGLASVSAGAAVATFFLSVGKFQQAEDQYQTYVGLTSGTSDVFSEQFNSSLDLQNSGRRLRTLSYAFSGAAVLCAGAGSYFFLAADDDSLSSRRPTVIPAVAVSDREVDVALSVSWHF